MAEYRLSPAAERDLEGIWKYTRGEWGLEQAERYTDLLTAAFQVLAESPKSAPACDHIRQAYRRRNVERGFAPRLEATGMRIYAAVFSSPALFRFAGRVIRWVQGVAASEPRRKWLARWVPGLRGWIAERTLPPPKKHALVQLLPPKPVQGGRPS